MSLDGNLRVFSLTEIFQMLGMQRKSGILTVEGPKDTINLAFVNGQIVGVESSSSPAELRLGSLLVKAGRLSQEGLEAALELQKKRPERLGRLLVGQGLVRVEDLREAFRIQVHRIVFQAFGWTDGRFRFLPESTIEHDPDLIAPIPTEAILLEAARTMDELPAAEKRISSNELVFRRAPAAAGVTLTTGDAQGGSVAVSRREAEIWKWIDGRRSVGEIRERAFLPDLEVLKGISDLLDRNLIVEEKRRESAPVAPVTRRRFSPLAALVWVVVLAAGVVAVTYVPRNRANLLFQPVAENAPAAGLFHASSLARILSLGRAVRVYYGTTGRPARAFEELVADRLVEESTLTDPYGRRYRYILRPEDGKFAIFGRDAAGRIDLALSHEGTLAPAVGVPVQEGQGPTPQAKPGVQVVR